MLEKREKGSPPVDWKFYTVCPPIDVDLYLDLDLDSSFVYKLDIESSPITADLDPDLDYLI